MNKNTIILGLLLLFSTGIIKADLWEDYKVTEYFSVNKKYRLVVTPTFTPEKYFKWKNFEMTKAIHNKGIDKRRAKFFKTLTAKDTVLIPCHGRLFCITGTDTVLIWERKLLNNICPVSAIVSNDGSSIITFDNWFTSGYGGNVMVVYNEKGDAKRTYSLSEISPYPLNDYHTSVSSIWWKSDAKFINKGKVEIEFCTEKKEKTKRLYNTEHLEFEEITTP